MREPSDEYERAPCERCGAATLDEAETRCQPWSDQSGEYYCAVPEDDVDGEGFLLRPTSLFYERMNAWVDEQLAKDCANAEKKDAEHG